METETILKSLSSLGRIPNVVIVGTGWAIRVQLPAFRAAGLNVLGIWAREEEKAKKLASELNISFGTSDFKAILERKDVDLISIVTPPFLHCEMACAALKAGKHVLCDKPTALNEQEALEMLKIANQVPSQLSLIDHELRFLPSYRKMKEFIQQGKCGNLIRLEAVRLNNFKLNTKRWDWWSEESKGGGLLGAVVSHLFDSLVYFTNLKPSIINFSHLQTVIKHREDLNDNKTLKPVTSDDDCLIHLMLEGGLPALLHASAVYAGKDEFSFTFYGTEGVLIWNDSRIFWYPVNKENSRVVSEGELLFSDEFDPLESNVRTSWGKGCYEFAKAIIDAALNKSNQLYEVAANFEDGLRVQQFLDKVRKSNQLQQPVKF